MLQVRKRGCKPLAGCGHRVRSARPAVRAFSGGDRPPVAAARCATPLALLVHASAVAARPRLPSRTEHSVIRRRCQPLLPCLVQRCLSNANPRTNQPCPPPVPLPQVRNRQQGPPEGQARRRRRARRAQQRGAAPGFEARRDAAPAGRDAHHLRPRCVVCVGVCVWCGGGGGATPCGAPARRVPRPLPSVAALAGIVLGCTLQ